MMRTIAPTISVAQPPVATTSSSKAAQRVRKTANAMMETHAQVIPVSIKPASTPASSTGHPAMMVMHAPQLAPVSRHNAPRARPLIAMIRTTAPTISAAQPPVATMSSSKAALRVQKTANAMMETHALEMPVSIKHAFTPASRMGHRAMTVMHVRKTALASKRSACLGIL